VVERMRIDEIIAATPSATGEQMRVITRHCREAGVPFKVLPATWEVLEGRASLGLAREVDINDLLRRPRVQLDLDAIGEFLTARRVLVTGAAGSIGAEICSQVLRFKPARLVCLDHAENGLFFLERNLARLGIAADISYCLADVTEGAHLDAIFRRERPDVVFHAAAHKHVPMLEANPVEGARNNVLGTETVATLAGRHGAAAFVMISTDKAVNPTSVMGATKRIAERLVQCLPFDTRYTTVRFGNVLGSAGSVVPILKDQIAAGGPVTITHPDMRRYFMTIPEAVELVLQAAAMGDGNEIFVLDMGEPVKIVDLANDLIRLSGLEPGRDIDIVFTGVRPGEKLLEELYLDAEAHRPTSHPKILVARHVPLDEAAFRRALDDLKQAIAAHDAGAVRRIIPRLVPEFQGDRAAGNVVPFEPAAPRGA
ncbi:MAG: polysaccharide biosynthesis protein, partial [Deltaproteobacteria bacterium]